MNAQARWQLQLPERPSQAGQDRNNKWLLKSRVIDWLETCLVTWKCQFSRWCFCQHIDRCSLVYRRTSRGPKGPRMLYSCRIWDLCRIQCSRKIKIQKERSHQPTKGSAAVLLWPSGWYHSSAMDVFNQMAVCPRCGSLAFRGIGKYSDYLAHQADVTTENHSLSHPVREGNDLEAIIIVPGFAWIKPTFAAWNFRA